MASKSKYSVAKKQHVLSHGGKRYEFGETVELTAAEAKAYNDKTPGLLKKASSGSSSSSSKSSK